MEQAKKDIELKKNDLAVPVPLAPINEEDESKKSPLDADQKSSMQDYDDNEVEVKESKAEIIDRSLKSNYEE